MTNEEIKAKASELLEHARADLKNIENKQIEIKANIEKACKDMDDELKRCQHNLEGAVIFAKHHNV